MTAAHLPIETVVRPRLPVDLRLTLGPLRRGPRDPTMLVDKAGRLVAGDQDAAGAGHGPLQRRG